MAKSKKKRTDESKAPGQPDPGIAAFEAGHYPEARAQFDLKLATDLSEGERRLIQALKSATGLDPNALKTGLACIGLYALVILVAILKQP